MRPRVFPAEDVLDRWQALRSLQASMRPRVFPAEDATERGPGPRGETGASMRPRVFPAEDEQLGNGLGFDLRGLQ